MIWTNTHKSFNWSNSTNCCMDRCITLLHIFGLICTLSISQLLFSRLWVLILLRLRGFLSFGLLCGSILWSLEKLILGLWRILLLFSRWTVEKMSFWSHILVLHTFLARNLTLLKLNTSIIEFKKFYKKNIILRTEKIF